MKLKQLMTLLLATLIGFTPLSTFSAEKQQSKTTKQAPKKSGKVSTKKTAEKKSAATAQSVQQYQQTGLASFYAKKFNGRKTANGEIYNDNLLTAAHRTLPLGTVVKVTNLRNGRQVTVRINDRGPFIKGRIIDLSRRAASEIGMIASGITQVKIETVKISGKLKSEAVAEISPKPTASQTKTPQPGEFIVQVRTNSETEAKQLAQKLQKTAQFRSESGRYFLILPANSQLEVNQIKQQLYKIGQFQIFTYSK